MSIHPTAIISADAKLDEGVKVHPFAVIEGDVEIGAGSEIGSHAVIYPGTRMGRENFVGPGAALGGTPQDRKFKGEESYLRIGNQNQLREYVTIHRATGEGEETVVGDDNMLMAYSHLGHNCRIGSHVMIANAVHCGGHVVIEDHAVLGGLSGVHQYTRIGTMSMIAASSAIRQDVPHYLLVSGDTARPRHVNVVGLRRQGVAPETIAILRRAFRLLYRSDYNISDAIEHIRDEFPMVPELERLLTFLEAVPQGRGGRQLN